MGKYLNIIKTNWVNIIGVFIAAFLYAIFQNVYDENVSRNFFQATLSALTLVCLYGVMFWGLFVISLIVFDLVFIAKDQRRLKIKLLSEWLIISLPFVFWAIRYEQWIFFIGIVAFLITQIFRERLIVRQKHSVGRTPRI